MYVIYECGKLEIEDCKFRMIRVIKNDDIFD